MFALPYDFRLGPKQYMEDAYPALKALIESAFAAGGNQKVVLSSISMGGPFGHVFLTQFVDQDWKDKVGVVSSREHPRHGISESPLVSDLHALAHAPRASTSTLGYPFRGCSTALR